jgi:hypothetical protein
MLSFGHDLAVTGGEGATMNDNAERRLLTNRRLVWLVAVAVVSTLVMFFVADNFVLTEIRFFNRGIQVRLAWVMIIPLLAGGSIGYLWGRLRR